ncbi:uncharacterized protein LOC111692233 [Anoplophora glabripennis]|uniref:uncharacterized protein LOC111692233 n=1 Tax=Anoplophora glabripennis TaxID=217634 RepID=UPI000C777B60|nr:uncharacterized protein LOC111692233 [Anoplophora glabripennis]
MPPISNMDIVSYLVLTHSYYSREQMKAYKSLQAYKYFAAGFVDKVGIKPINDYVLLVGKVQHSMKAREPKLRVWVIAERHGGICTAHCSAWQGLGRFAVTLQLYCMPPNMLLALIRQ